MRKELPMLTKGSEKSGFVVNSENLLRYLFSQPTHFQIKFERELNLKYLTPYLKEFSSTGSESAKERATVVYYSAQDSRLLKNEVFEGDSRSVNLECDEPNEIQSPLFLIHNHLRSSLFSPEDYLPILTKADNGKRLIPAGIIFCPDGQILAFANPNTPLLTRGKAADFFRFWRDSRLMLQKHFFETDGHIARRERWLKPSLADQDNEALKRIQSFWDKFFKEKITLNQMAMMSVDQNSFGQDYSDFVRRLSLVSQKHKLRHYAKNYREENSANIELARTTGVSLYFSTDMTIFRQFSA